MPIVVKIAAMRAVIQRVSESSVKINNQITGKISQGLLVLLGIEESDSYEDIEWLSGKIIRLRIFNDTNGIMNLSVKEINGEILVISQFTLHASTKKGNRPSYIKAAKPDIAIPLYNQFLNKLTIDFGGPVQTGVFGAMMKVSLINDGPVTIIIDSKQKE
jgi:D-aminoacyl-tRNA deacylase